MHSSLMTGDLTCILRLMSPSAILMASRGDEHGAGLQMLDRISEVQMVHNRHKTAAMHDILDDGEDENGSAAGEHGV